MAKKFNITILSLLCLSLYGCNSENNSAFPEKDASKLKLKATQVLMESLNSDEIMVKINAIEAAASSKQQSFLPKIESLLGNDYVPVRFAATVAIGDTEYKPATPKLNFLLEKGDENSKIAAAYALYRFGEKDKISIVKNSLSSKDMTVRANAVMLLGKTGNKEFLEILHKTMIASDSDDKVSQQAVQALAKLGDEKIINKIWTLVLSIYADDRIIGLEALGSLKTSTAKEIIMTKLEDELPEVRLMAAGQLGKFGDTSGEAVVIEILQKNDAGKLENRQLDQIQTLAAMAIGEIGTKNLQEHLGKLLESQYKTVKIAAARSVFLTSGKY